MIWLTHDACGRVIERRVERQGFRPRLWRYGWDAQDRLVSCLTPEGARWRYAYDPFGRRILKRRDLPPPPRGHVPRAPRRAGSVFAWDGDVVAEEIPLAEDGTLDYDARVDWHFEPDSFTPLAKVVHGSRAVPPAPGSLDPRRRKTAELSYIVTDHLGTPREALSEAGALEWAASYRLWGSLRAAEAWGREAVNGATAGDGGEPGAAEAACPLRFPGQWEDEESGLYYNRHRYYDPLVGQYASPDPIGLEGGDRPQGYVTRPSQWIDPLGLQRSAFSQTTASPNFSKGGTFEGKTISDVASQLRSGQINPADVPVQIVVKEGKKLIVNTRSSLALKQAGIPEDQWKIIDKTGDLKTMNDIADRLVKNGLDSSGTETLKITRSGPNVSTLIGGGSVP